MDIHIKMSDFMDEELQRIREMKMKEMIKNLRRDRMETVIEVNDESFQEKVIEQSKGVPVVVDFWAQWCMPCMMLGPTLDKLAKDYNEKFVLAKVNMESSRGLAQRYGIMSIPAVKMFKNGKVVDEFVGALPEPQIKDWIDRNLGDS